MRNRATKRRKDPAFWKSPGFWKALNRVLAALIVLALVAIVVFSFSPELIRRKSMTSALNEKKAEMAALQLLQKKREREVFLLENDIFYIETLARDKLDLMKEGETIFRLEIDPPPNSGPEQK